MSMRRSAAIAVKPLRRSKSVTQALRASASTVGYQAGFSSPTSNNNTVVHNTETVTAKIQGPFAKFRSSDLAIGYLVLAASSFAPLVNYSEGLLSISNSILGYKFTNFVIKNSFYRHFCGGEFDSEVEVNVEKLKARGTIPMLDYAVEGPATEDGKEDIWKKENLRNNLLQLDFVNSYTKGGISPIKPTAIGSANGLINFSTLLREQSLEWNEERSSMGSKVKDKETFIEDVLSPIEDTNLREQIEPMASNIFDIGEKASQLGQKIMIDAEYYSMQEAIDYIAYKSMKHFNVESVVFLNTVQCYLKQADNVVDKFVSLAETDNFKLGLKLVRGAYMNHERNVNKISPVHDTVNDTHSCYNNSAFKLLENLEQNPGHFLVCATHNAESVRLVAEKLDGLPKTTQERVYFAQLNGMADSVTSQAINMGLKAYKLLPFGPVGEVIPYLLRRAQENNSMLSKTLHERKLIGEELWKRMFFKTSP